MALSQLKAGNTPKANRRQASQFKPQVPTTAIHLNRTAG